METVIHENILKWLICLLANLSSALLEKIPGRTHDSTSVACHKQFSISDPSTFMLQLHAFQLLFLASCGE
jgi:hypothetical protein